MRLALKQLWLLYGPDGFVTDLQELLLSKAGSVPGATPADLAQEIGRRVDAGESGLDALLLKSCASSLLLDPVSTLAHLASGGQLEGAVRRALAQTGRRDGLAAHFESVVAHAEKRVASAMGVPAVLRGLTPAICLFGRHSHRTPLAYAPIRRMVGDRLRLTLDLAAADVVVTGFNIDLRENAEILVPLLHTQPRLRVAVISEEPLWDITWSGTFTGRNGLISTDFGEIDYSFLSHETSKIFDFAHLPYFVLTNEKFAVRYFNLLSRPSEGAEALIRRWRAAPIPAAFFVEHRNDAIYRKCFPDRDVVALSAYRTEVAELVAGEGVLRVGKGWNGGGQRQDRPDWHLEKLAWLDGRTRLLSAYENVHQHAYVTEKIFDAFSVGAIPAYWADPKHRIHELVLEGAMLNTYGLEPATAAARIAEFEPDLTFVEAWLAARAALRDLFADVNAVAAERRRVADAVVREIIALA